MDYPGTAYPNVTYQHFSPCHKVCSRLLLEGEEGVFSLPDLLHCI